jgi:magnesium-transporting ATPase (P-type)
VLEFSSDRKRMSTVIRTPTGRLLAFVKGADNAVLAKARPDTPQSLLKQLDQDLHTFSTQVIPLHTCGITC